MSIPQKEQASDKEKFDLLRGMLNKYYEGLFDGFIKTAGILIVVGGWVATSESLSNLLKGNGRLRYFGVAVVIAAYALYVRIAWRVYYLSGETYRLLEELDYMDPKYYAHQRIICSTFIVYCAANLLLTAGVVVLLVNR
jgi:hypothetical protein